MILAVLGSKLYIMFHNLRDNFLKRVDFSKEELDSICSCIVVKKVKKKKSVLIEGNIPNSVIYVNQGVLRMFTNDEDFEEQTFDFAAENCWMADLEGFKNQRPSKVNIEAIEDSELFLLQYQDVVKLHKVIPKLERFSRFHAEEKYIEAMNRLQKINHPNYSAEERYLAFMMCYPYLINRIPLTYLASYLGIAAETLSRVRKSLSALQSPN